MADLHEAAAGDLAGRSALRRCIAIDAAAFAERHWGARPLLTRAADLSAGFADLLSADAVDELVSRRGLRTPFLRMAKDGSVIASGRFTRSGGAGATAADQVADDRVLELIGDGATLVLQGLHRTWPPLVEFASALAAELGHPVQVNAYITPPQNQGFAAHYDVHDVFVLQVAGRKTWRIHEPVFPDPLADHPWDKRKDAVAERAAEAPLIDEVLEPGDALYLPRGFLHSAAALGETSIHLTVGVHPITRYQLVRHLLDLAQDDPALRASLPMGADLGDAGVLEPHLQDTVAALRARLGLADAQVLAERIGADLMRRTRPAPLAPLAQLAAADALAPDTLLRLRPGLRCQLQRDATSVTLRLLDKSVALPIAADAAVKTILTGAQFTPDDLAGLDAEEQLVVARRLLRDGVIVPAISAG